MRGKFRKRVIRLQNEKGGKNEAIQLPQPGTVRLKPSERKIFANQIGRGRTSKIREERTGRQACNKGGKERKYYIHTKYQPRQNVKWIL